MIVAWTLGSHDAAAAESDCLEGGVDCASALGHEVPVVGTLLGLAGDLKCLGHLLNCLPSASPSAAPSLLKLGSSPGSGAGKNSLADPAALAPTRRAQPL